MAKKSPKSLIPVERIDRAILVIRDQKVLLDAGHDPLHLGDAFDAAVGDLHDVPPAVRGSESPIAMKSVARTRIGPFRQLSSVISRLVAPW